MTTQKPPEPWSDEWIDALADETWISDDGVYAFARAVAAKAMEEAANVVLGMGGLWTIHGSLPAKQCADLIRARAQEIAGVK